MERGRSWGSLRGAGRWLQLPWPGVTMWRKMDAGAGGPRAPKGMDPFGAQRLRPTQHCLVNGWKLSPADPAVTFLCLRGPGSCGGFTPQVPASCPGGCRCTAGSVRLRLS